MAFFTRREFIKGSASLGIGYSFLGALFKRGSSISLPKAKFPIVLSSGTHGLKANEAAWKVLSAGGNSLDAVEKGANAIETDPEDTSVGLGGLPNEEGVVQLDASVMYGPTFGAGAVGALENIATPSSVARLVMERTTRIFLVGEGALKFALAHGFKKTNLLTEKARKIWLLWKETMSDRDDWLPPADWRNKYPEFAAVFDELWLHEGTINVLAIDAEGNISGITTTSGLPFKLDGRVGDSPIIGAGLYVDQEVGAAGATGRGEEVIRTCGSYYVVENMRKGMDPDEACRAAAERIVKVNKGKANFQVNFVALRKDGKFGAFSIRSGFKFAVYNERGNNLYDGKYLFKRKGK